MSRCKRIVSYIVIVSMVCGLFLHSTVQAEENKLEISAEKLSLIVGNTKTLKVTGTSDTVKWSSSKKSVATVTSKGKVKARNAGTAEITATVGEEQVSCTVTVTNKKIRVLLKTTDFSNMYHNSITLTSGEDFTVSNGAKTKKYSGGKSVTIKTTNSMLKKGALTIKAANNGKIKVTSIKRSQGQPSYRGYFVIRYVKGKGLTLVNHLDLEEYLYSVVGSEMSSSFSKEALKAQAVTARSFAYAHLNSSKYASVFADLDDSTGYQVYNNIKEASSVISAVKATKNTVLKSENNKILATYFFSTSAGQTCLPSEVWGGSGEDLYYNSVLQIKDGTQKDLSTNTKFKNFYKDDITTFDSKADWYRWSVKISKANLQKGINNKIKSCYALYPSYVKVLQKNGTYKSQSISSIGTLKNLSIESRTKRGIVKTIKITGSAATVKISNATAIRMILAPFYDTVIKQNGSKVSKLSSLPSDFFYVVKNASGSSVSYTIYGGGYGHGIGMSQNGANQMAKEGYKYKEILGHYYKNLDVKNVAD